MKYLNKIREEKGLTFAQLSSAADYDRGGTCRAVNNPASVGMDAFIRIAGVLGIKKTRAKIMWKEAKKQAAMEAINRKFN